MEPISSQPRSHWIKQIFLASVKKSYEWSIQEPHPTVRNHDRFIHFLARNNVKFQIRADGLIKCKYVPPSKSSQGTNESLKFKIEISENEWGNRVKATHQLGPMHLFDALVQEMKSLEGTDCERRVQTNGAEEMIMV